MPPTTILLSSLLGCGPVVTDVQVAPTEKVATVLEVSWQLDEDMDGTWVSYRLEDGTEGRTPAQDGSAGAHRALVMGVHALEDVTLSVVAESGGEEQRTGDQSVQAGNIPASLPEFEIDTWDSSATDQPWLLGATLEGTGGGGALFIVDRNGAYIWYQVVPDDTIRTEVVPALDGDGLLANSFGAAFDVDSSSVERLAMDGTEVSSTHTPMGHHVFTELPDGSLSWLALDVRDTDEYGAVVGDALAEADPSGDQRTVWSVWDWLEPVYNPGWDIEFYPQGIDWTHGNAIYYEEDTDRYLVSMANIDTIAEIDRASGQVTRCFGAVDGCYGFEESDDAFHFQHGANITPSGTLLVTSSVGAFETRRTSAREYAIHDDTETLELVWSYQPELGAMALGDVHREPNGHTLVNFGSTGVVQEVDQDGNLLWSMGTGAGFFFGRTDLVEDLYSMVQ